MVISQLHHEKKWIAETREYDEIRSAAFVKLEYASREIIKFILRY